MRQFFRNIFYTDFPAQGAFAGIILFVFGTMIYGSLLTSSGKIHGMIFYPLAGYLPVTIALLFLPVILFLSYALHTNCRFLFKCGGFRQIIKHRWSLIVNLFCFAAAVYGLYHGTETFRQSDMLLSCHFYNDAAVWKIMLPEQYRVWAVWAGVIFLLLWLASTARIYAAAEEINLRKMFGKTVLTIFCLCIAVHVLTIFLARSSQEELEQKKADLEKAFETAINCESFCQRYYNGRKPDSEFWNKAHSLQEKLNDLKFLFLPAPTLTEADQKTINLWQKQLSAHKSFPELEKLFSGPLPPRKQEINKGTMLNSFSMGYWLRRFAAAQYWKIRFAVNERNIEAIVDSLEKMRYCSDSLSADLMFPSALNLLAVETFRLKALEQVIGADLLSDGQLLRQKTMISKMRNQLPEIRKNALFGETVLAFDWLTLSYETVQQFCFLTPAIAHLWNKNLLHIANSFLCAKQKNAYQIPRDSTGILANAAIPAVDHFDIRLKYMEANFLAMEKMIDLHLYKRKKGTYPEYPDALPPDPFTRKEMIYYVGELPLRKIFVSHDLSEEKTVLVQTHTAAIWSCGKNRKDDTGSLQSDDTGIFIVLTPEKKR